MRVVDGDCADGASRGFPSAQPEPQSKTGRAWTGGREHVEIPHSEQNLKGNVRAELFWLIDQEGSTHSAKE